MKLQKILKSIKKESKLTFLLSFLPITLLVGILWQIAILSKYNSVLFFSWWQVLNDTAILMLQVIVFFLWVLSAYFFYFIKPKKVEKFFSLVLLFIFFVFSWIIIVLFLKNVYIYWLISSYLLWYLSYVITFIVWNKWRNIGKNDNYIIPVIFNVLVLSIILLFWFILNYFYSFLYQNIELKTNNENHQINYMNDKYIIYSSWSETKIIPNDWKNEFIIKDSFKQKN